MKQAATSYHKAMYWGEFQDAAAYIPPYNQMAFLASSREKRRVENVVEIQPGAIEFDADIKTAKVEVLVRVFKTPTFTVVTRKEVEDWEYNDSRGWFMMGTKEVGMSDEAGGPFYR